MPTPRKEHSNEQKSEKKSSFKLKNNQGIKACIVALSLWGFPLFLLSFSPVMAADTASNTAQEQVAKALRNNGTVLTILSRYKEAFFVYNELIIFFNDSQDPIIQKQVVTARYHLLGLMRLLS